MGTEYTAMLSRINDNHCDSDGNIVPTDTVAVYKGDVRVALVYVDSSEDPAGYDDAVAKFLGSHDFKWVY